MIPTSTVLENLVKREAVDTVTLDWLLQHLKARSFGMVLLLLGILGLLPVISPIAGIMLTLPAFQMIRADAAPAFPRKMAQRPFPAARLRRMVLRITPTLRYLEQFVKPRWATPFRTTKRIVGAVVLLLGIGLLAPFPLSNVPAALTIILVAFAYLEEDGILLAAALTIALVLFGLGGTALWRSIGGAVSLMR